MTKLWCRRTKFTREDGCYVVWHGLMDADDARREAATKAGFIICFPDCGGATHGVMQLKSHNEVDNETYRSGPQHWAGPNYQRWARRA